MVRMTLTVGYLVPPNFEVMSLAAMSVFEMANTVAGDRVYDVVVISETGGHVVSSIGASVSTEPFEGLNFDTVIVAGGTQLRPVSRATIAYLRRAATRARRMAAICVGAFALADADLLNGRRATTHWRSAAAMRKRFPKITIEDDRIVVVDGPVWTSAGMTAGIDLALGMVEEDLGSDVAARVAAEMVVHQRRAGGQSLFAATAELLHESERVRAALDHARANLRSELSVAELAGVVGLSSRQLSRAFQAETGQSPAKAIEQLRLAAARQWVEKSTVSIDVIAVDVGFGGRERMRRAFLRRFGLSPQAIRRLGRGSDLTPGSQKK